jgi:hypothetical protein
MNPTTLPIFDIATWVILALTAFTIFHRMQDSTATNWPLVYILPVMFYYKAFPGALATWPVFLLLCSVAFLRTGALQGMGWKFLRAFELALMAYIVWRSISLLAGW